MPGDAACDTIVAAYESDGTTLLGRLDSDDSGYHEDHLSGAITAAGTYYIKVWANGQYWSSTATNYQLMLTVE